MVLPFSRGCLWSCNYDPLFHLGKLLGVKGCFLRQGRKCNLCDLTLGVSGERNLEVCVGSLMSECDVPTECREK